MRKPRVHAALEVPGVGRALYRFDEGGLGAYGFGQAQASSDRLSVGFPMASGPMAKLRMANRFRDNHETYMLHGSVSKNTFVSRLKKGWKSTAMRARSHCFISVCLTGLIGRSSPHHDYHWAQKLVGATTAMA
jgi:hypothetical protein